MILGGETAIKRRKEWRRGTSGGKAISIMKSVGPRRPFDDTTVDSAWGCDDGRRDGSILSQAVEPKTNNDDDHHHHHHQQKSN